MANNSAAIIQKIQVFMMNQIYLIDGMLLLLQYHLYRSKVIFSILTPLYDYVVLVFLGKIDLYLPFLQIRNLWSFSLVLNTKQIFVWLFKIFW